MNTKFDELTKSMAQSVTRRAALKKFGLGLAGMALAAFGLLNRAEANPKTVFCNTDSDCPKGQVCSIGQCFRPCTTAKDCRGKEGCYYGVCFEWQML